MAKSKERYPINDLISIISSDNVKKLYTGNKKGNYKPDFGKVKEFTTQYYKKFQKKFSSLDKQGKIIQWEKDRATTAKKNNIKNKSEIRAFETYIKNSITEYVDNLNNGKTTEKGNTKFNSKGGGSAGDKLKKDDDKLNKDKKSENDETDEPSSITSKEAYAKEKAKNKDGVSDEFWETTSNDLLQKPVNKYDPVVHFNTSYPKQVLTTLYDSDALDDASNVEKEFNVTKIYGIKYPLIKLANRILKQEEIGFLKISSLTDDILPTIILTVYDDSKINQFANTMSTQSKIHVVIAPTVEGKYKAINLWFSITDISNTFYWHGHDRCITYKGIMYSPTANSTVDSDGLFGKQTNGVSVENNESKTEDKSSKKKSDKSSKKGKKTNGKHKAKEKTAKLTSWEYMCRTAQKCGFGFQSTIGCETHKDGRVRATMTKTYLDLIKSVANDGGSDEKTIFDCWVDVYGYLTMVNVPMVFDAQNIKPWHLGCYAEVGLPTTTAALPQPKLQLSRRTITNYKKTGTMTNLMFSNIKENYNFSNINQDGDKSFYCANVPMSLADSTTTEEYEIQVGATIKTKDGKENTTEIAKTYNSSSSYQDSSIEFDIDNSMSSSTYENKYKLKKGDYWVKLKIYCSDMLLSNWQNNWVDQRDLDDNNIANFFTFYPFTDKLADEFDNLDEPGISWIEEVDAGLDAFVIDGIKYSELKYVYRLLYQNYVAFTPPVWYDVINTEGQTIRYYVYNYLLINGAYGETNSNLEKDELRDKIKEVMVTPAEFLKTIKKKSHLFPSSLHPTIKASKTADTTETGTLVVNLGTVDKYQPYDNTTYSQLINNIKLPIFTHWCEIICLRMTKYWGDIIDSILTDTDLKLSNYQVKAYEYYKTCTIDDIKNINILKKYGVAAWLGSLDEIFVTKYIEISNYNQRVNITEHPEYDYHTILYSQFDILQEYIMKYFMANLENTFNEQKENNIINYGSVSLNKEDGFRIYIKDIELTEKNIKNIYYCYRDVYINFIKNFNIQKFSFCDDIINLLNDMFNIYGIDIKVTRNNITNVMLNFITNDIDAIQSAFNFNLDTYREETIRSIVDFDKTSQNVIDIFKTLATK